MQAAMNLLLISYGGTLLSHFNECKRCAYMTTQINLDCALYMCDFQGIRFKLQITR